MQFRKMQPRKRRQRLMDVEARMPGTTVEAGNDVLRLPVAEIDPVAGVYERLGLAVRRPDPNSAVVELPCGITLVLARAVRRGLVPAA